MLADLLRLKIMSFMLVSRNVVPALSTATLTALSPLQLMTGRPVDTHVLDDRTLVECIHDNVGGNDISFQ